MAKQFSAEQTQKVFDLLAQGALTRVTAMHYGIMNLTARISDIRKAGYTVYCEIKRDIDGRKYGSFYMPDHDVSSWRIRLGIGS